MTIRINPSPKMNLFHDAERVDQEDLDLEQTRNVQVDSAIINNFFGSGILPFSPQQNLLFDSDILSPAQAALVAVGEFDGTGIQSTNQPSDINLGNQLEIQLTDSIVMGRNSTKVAIIGLDFAGNIQMDRLYFYKNETQVTAKHYKRILALFFNDFKGNFNCSRNNGGRITIKESKSFELSRDPIAASQDVEPDIFWRDWKVPILGDDLEIVIQTGIGNDFSVDGLDINTTGQPNLELLPNDVVAQVGEKFLATTNNIQKITLLLSVSKDDTTDLEHEFDWNGDLVVSIYPLQTSVSCPTDIIPQLAIDFDPSPIPLVQISFNQQTLRDAGYVLDNVLQPVDFVLNNTKVADPNSSSIVPGKYYVITAKRSGAATSGVLYFGCGLDRYADGRVSLFSGVWVDVTTQDLWFQVWSDSAKYSDGIGFDAGNGIEQPKTIIDPLTGATIDNQAGYFSFADTGENILNTGVIQAIEDDTVKSDDERSGTPIFSRKQFVPSFSFVDDADLAALELVAEPLKIGAMQDTNPKQNPELTKNQTLPGLAKGNQFCVVNPDADLLSLNLLGSKLIPNNLNSGIDYSIAKVTLCTNLYGDVNGDGVFDQADLTRLSQLVGENLTASSTQQKILAGEFSTLEFLRADLDADGYITAADVDLLTNYLNKVTNSFPVGSSFSSLCLTCIQSVGRFDGYWDCGDGYDRIFPTDGYSEEIIDTSTLNPFDLLFDGYNIAVHIESDPIFTTTPFPGTTYKIKPQPYWQPYGLAISSDVKLTPASFTSPNQVIQSNCGSEIILCQDRNDITPTFDKGRNDIFVPDNFYIGTGEILRPDNSFYPIDLEIQNIILELPATPLSQVSIDIFHSLIAEAGNGQTSKGFKAACFSDKSFVSLSALALNQCRFTVALQSIHKNEDGYEDSLGFIIIEDDIIGVTINDEGILQLNIKNLSVDPVLTTLISKIQVTVFLKKAGFVNNTLFVTSNQIQGLIS